MKQLIIFILILIFSNCCYAENKILERVSDRVRVIIDNDFGGDPDGLFQLAHQLLSPSGEVKAIIASQHYSGGFYGNPGDSAFSRKQVDDLLAIMKLPVTPLLFTGSDGALSSTRKAKVTQAAKYIVEEAMRDDKRPLYIVCGAGLTTIASALLMKPEIAQRMTLVWIGGPEYPEFAYPPPNAQPVEYNIGIDIKAAQVVFNYSSIPIWQVPRDSYRQAIVSLAELKNRMNEKGALAKYMLLKLNELLVKADGTLGETYVMGDNPLTLLSVLQTSWEKDPASSKYVVKKSPLINNNGAYEENKSARNIRVYTHIDTRLMFEDFFAKVAYFDGPNLLKK